MAQFRPTQDQLDAMERLGLSPRFDGTLENMFRLAVVVDLLIQQAYPDIDLEQKQGYMDRMLKNRNSKR